MPTKRTVYQYKPGDDPLAVANQFGITPQQLLAANPGGSPFATGQQVIIPQFQYNAPTVNPNQYSAPIGPQPQPTLLQQRMAQSVPSFLPGTYEQSEKGGTPFSPTGYGTDDSWYRPTPAGTTSTPATQPGIQAPAADNTDYSKTRAAQQYAAAGTAFVNQMRWDPQARRYVSIGRLLRQGKLDLQGNWRRQSRRQRRNAAIERKNRQEVKEQDFTLSNSLISFGAGSG